VGGGQRAAGLLPGAARNLPSCRPAHQTGQAQKQLRQRKEPRGPGGLGAAGGIGCRRLNWPWGTRPPQQVRLHTSGWPSREQPAPAPRAAGWGGVVSEYFHSLTRLGGGSEYSQHYVVLCRCQRAQCQRLYRPAPRGRRVGLSSGWPRARTVRGSSLSVRQLCARSVRVCVFVAVARLTRRVMWMDRLKGIQGGRSRHNLFAQLDGRKAPQRSARLSREPAGLQQLLLSRPFLLSTVSCKCLWGKCSWSGRPIPVYLHYQTCPCVFALTRGGSGNRSRSRK
jgi:hypothetical protein